MLPPCGINLGRINALRSYWLDFVVLAAPQVENELNLRPGTTIEETGECLGKVGRVVLALADNL